MTFKTHFYRSLLACVCAQALCVTANADSGWKPYVGAGVGYSVVDFKNDHYEAPAGGDSAILKGSAVARGVAEALFVGVQKHHNNMAFGSELYGYLSQQSGKMQFVGANSDSRHETMRRRYGYGVKLKGGYFVNPTALAYIHAGIENANFQYAGVVNLLNAHKWQHFKARKNLLGLPFGAGLEVEISPVWKTRFEYTYTKYRTWKTGDVLPSTDVFNSKLSPRQHTIAVGFSYQV